MLAKEGVVTTSGPPKIAIDASGGRHWLSGGGFSRAFPTRADAEAMRVLVEALRPESAG